MEVGELHKLISVDKADKSHSALSEVTFFQLFGQPASLVLALPSCLFTRDSQRLSIFQIFKLLSSKCNLSPHYFLRECFLRCTSLSTRRKPISLRLYLKLHQPTQHPSLPLLQQVLVLTHQNRR